jgi:hypothetical protein
MHIYPVSESDSALAPCPAPLHVRGKRTPAGTQLLSPDGVVSSTLGWTAHNLDVRLLVRRALSSGEEPAMADIGGRHLAVSVYVTEYLNFSRAQLHPAVDGEAM